MKRIYAPTKGTDDWQGHLADHEKQWKPNHSALALANCWEEANGFLPEVVKLFAESGIATFDHLKLLLAIPEYQVVLPGGGHASQNDIFVLAKDAAGRLVSIMVEGKVSEPFGPLESVMNL